MNRSTLSRTAGAGAAALWLLAGALACAQVDTNSPAGPPPGAPDDQPPDAAAPAAPTAPPSLAPGITNRGALPPAMSPERLEQVRKALDEARAARALRGATNAPAGPIPARPGVSTPARTTVTNAGPPAVPALPALATNVAPRRASTPVTLPPGIAPPAPTAVAGQAALPAGEPGGGTSGAPPLTPAAPANAPYVFSWKNAPLDQIFEKYMEVTGRTVLQPATLPGAVTLFTSPTTTLTREEAVQALDGALALNGVVMIPLGEKFVKAVLSADAAAAGGRLNYRGAKDLPEAEQFVTHVVQLKVVLPSEMAQLFASFTKNPQGIVPIDSSQILVLRDYASNIKRMVELIEKVDIEPESEYKLEVIPIKYGRVGDLYDTMSSLVSGGAGGGAVRTGTQRRTGATAAGFGTAYGTGGRPGGTTSRYGGTTGRFGQTPGTGMQPQAVAGQTPAQGAAGASFQQRLNQIVSRAAGESGSQVLGDARIVPDERANSLIVYANKHDMVVITNIVNKVDVLLAQVLIEGIVLGVSIGDTLDVGVSWAQNTRKFGNDFTGAGVINNGLLGALTNFPSGSPGGFSYFGKIGDDITVALRAAATDSRVRVLQRPRIQTSHAVPGMFFSGSTVPYVTGFYNYGGYGSVGTQSQVEQIQVGVNLNVTPYITPDGLVVLDIFQDISQLGDYVTIDNNQVPTTTSRSAQATLSVRDGETIMLGGYIEDSRTSGKSGVPILKDIPGLGALFRSKTLKNSRQELILLMKVTVLKNPSDASALVESAKASLPGVRKAEQEFLKTEQDAEPQSAKHALKEMTK